MPVSHEYCIFKMGLLCYYVHLNLMVQHFLPFQIVPVPVFRAFLDFLYLLTIPESEIRKKNREEDLKQTRRDPGLFSRKRLATMTNVSFLILLFQRAKIIISVLVTWMIVDCNLDVRVLLSF